MFNRPTNRFIKCFCIGVILGIYGNAKYSKYSDYNELFKAYTVPILSLYALFRFGNRDALEASIGTGLGMLLGYYLADLLKSQFKIATHFPRENNNDNMPRLR